MKSGIDTGVFDQLNGSAMRLARERLPPAKTPGIHRGKPDRKMGQRRTRTGDVVLGDLRLPPGAVIGMTEQLNKAFATAMRVPDRGCIHLSGLATGVRRIVVVAARHVTEQRQLGGDGYMADNAVKRRCRDEHLPGIYERAARIIQIINGRATVEVVVQ